MADVISFGSDEPRGPRRRWIAVVGAVALAVVVSGIVVDRLGDHDSTPDARTSPSVGTSPPAATAPTADPGGTGVAAPPPGDSGPPCVLTRGISPAPTDAPAGVALDLATDSATDSCDPQAVKGPWSVVVRRADGRLGRGEAVVTFPVEPPAGGAPVTQTGLMVWVVGGGWARIRGDLDRDELATLADRTTVAGGRPIVHPPSGYTVAATTPYRPPSVREIRYGTGDTGEQAALGDGLTYTGIVAAGGFVDSLYAGGIRDVAMVHGLPAVVSTVHGGNATIAWQPVPGLVAYVGYSGASLDAPAVAALVRLGNRARLLTDDQWRALSVQTVDQTNDPG